MFRLEGMALFLHVLTYVIGALASGVINALADVIGANIFFFFGNCLA